LNEFFQNNKIEKAIVIGHSMGGKTAMQFALLNPEKVEKLIIIDVSPNSYKSIDSLNKNVIEHLNIVSALLSLDTHNIKTRKDADIKLSETISNERTRQFLLKNLQRSNKGEYFWGLNIDAIAKQMPKLMGSIEIESNIIKPINCNVLFIKGGKSNYIQANDLTEIKKIFSNATMVTFSNAGHWVHVDQGELFIKTIYDFLAQF
jgi:pimeloyl-ACP methyl ester carboxylesterase